MRQHKATVRGRRIEWDDREVVQHGVNVDAISLDLDAEWGRCDDVVVFVKAPHMPESVKLKWLGEPMPIPAELMSETCVLATCVVGFGPGEGERLVTAAEGAPLSIEQAGVFDPSKPPLPPQPDLWATLMEEVRKATEGAKTAAQSATRAEADLRAAAERGDFDGEDGKTPVRGVDYWTAEDRKPIEDATLAALTSAGKADAAAATATEGEASRIAAEAERANAEAARAEAELARGTAETGRVEAEATRAAHESKRIESFNTNLVSWNLKVDAACKKATDTASKAAQDAKTATDAAIAKTEEATNAAIAKVQTATDNATAAANKAEAAVAQLPVPSGNVLKGEAEATLVHVDDAYPAPLVTTKVLGQSNQQQEPAPSHENPQEITNLTKAELVITGKNLINADGAKKSGWNVLLPNTKLMNGATYVFTAPKCKQTCSIYATASDTRLVGYISSGKTERFTVPSNADFSKGCFIAGGSVDSLEDMSAVLNTVMVEVGTVAGAYAAPKKPTITPIDLQGNELCSLPKGVKDEVVIDAEGNVSLIKRTKQYNWNCVQIIKGTGRNYAVDKVLDIGANYTGLVAEKAISTVNNSVGICYVNQKMIYVTVPESVATKEQANQLYGGMKVIYQLAEPQTIPLGKVELPALPEATSNVCNDGNIPANVYINYLKDVNIAFSKLESKLTQAVVATAANL